MFNSPIPQAIPFPAINEKMTPEQLTMVRTGEGGRPYVADDVLADHLAKLDPTGFGTTWARAKKEQPRFQAADGTDIPYATAALNNYVLGKYDAYVPTKTRGFKLSDIHPSLNKPNANPFVQQNQVEQKPLTDPPIVGGVLQSAKDMGSAMINDIKQAGTKATETSGRKDLNIVGKVGGVVGDLTLGGANVLAEPFKPTIKAVVDLLNAGSEYATKNYPVGPTTLKPEQKIKLEQDLANTAQAIEHFSKANPNIAQSLKGVAGVVSMALAAQGLESSMNTVGSGMESLGKGATDKIKEIPKVLDSMKSSSLEKSIVAGKNPPIEEVAKYPELFKKYADQYGIRMPEGSMDNLTLAQGDSLEAARVKILQDAQQKASLSDIQKSVMPPTTKKNFQEASANLKKEGSFFKAPSLEPTQNQVELAKVADSLKSKGYSPKKSPIANEKVVQSAWENESKSLLAKMKANDAVSPDQEILSSIKGNLEKQGLSVDTGVGKKVYSVWEDALTSNSNGKISGQWQSKINFSKEAMRKWGNAIYDKGTDLADAVNAAHEAANNVIVKNASRAGIDYAGQMDRLTKIHQIMENLKLQQSGEVLRSTAGNIVRSKPFKIGATTAATAAGIGAGVKLLP